MIDETVSKLAVYALQTGLIQENEYTWANWATGGDLRASELTAKHAAWAEGFDGKNTITWENALDTSRRKPDWLRPGYGARRGI